MEDNTKIVPLSEQMKVLSKALRNPFPTQVLKYRVGATTKDKSKGIALFYLTARDIATRLDEVVGAGNWDKTTELFYEKTKPNGEETLAYARTTISILINGRWVSKDGIGTPSSTEGDKGAESDSFKRAAISWGIGRYLYYLPNNLWLELDEHKRFTSDPRKNLPKWAFPNQIEDWEKVAIDTYADDGNLDLENISDDLITDEERDLLAKSEEIRQRILATKKGQEES